MTNSSKLSNSLPDTASGPSRPTGTGRLYNGNPPGDLRLAPRCGARTRAGSSCRQPAMRNGRCRLHGGKSTGPRTHAGRARCAEARLVHGMRGRDFIALTREGLRRRLRLAALGDQIRAIEAEAAGRTPSAAWRRRLAEGRTHAGLIAAERAAAAAPRIPGRDPRTGYLPLGAAPVIDDLDGAQALAARLAARLVGPLVAPLAPVGMGCLDGFGEGGAGAGRPVAVARRVETDFAAAERRGDGAIGIGCTTDPGDAAIPEAHTGLARHPAGLMIARRRRYGRRRHGRRRYGRRRYGLAMDAPGCIIRRRESAGNPGVPDVPGRVKGRY